MGTVLSQREGGKEDGEAEGMRREGGQKERKGEGEKDPPLSEASGNKSSHLSSAGGESAVQTSRRLLLSLLSFHPSSLTSFLSTPQTEQDRHRRRKKERRAPKIKYNYFII